MAGKNIDTLFKENKLNVITFSTTDASFAIPLEQILYIEKDMKRNLQLNELAEFNHEIITFQENAVQLFDFNNLIGSKSYQSTMKNLVSQLDNMEQQHIQWLNALEDSLKNKTPFTKTLDPNQCEFSQWYKTFKTDNEELSEIMQRIEAPHAKLHSMANELLTLNQTDPEDALRQLEQQRQNTLATLIRLFQLAKEHANNSVRPIILFVEHNEGKVSALRLDNIQDIVDYNRKDFSHDDSTDGIMKKRNDDFVIEGFLRHGDDAPLMLINCQPCLPNSAEKVA